MLVSWDQDKGLYDHSTDLGKCVRRLIRANASGSCTQAEDLSDGPDSRVSKGARRGRPLSCVLRGCGKGQLSLSALRRQPIDSWQVFCLVSPNGGYNQLSAGVRVNPTAKTVAFWLVIVLFSALAYQVAHSTKSGATPGISFSEFSPKWTKAMSAKSRSLARKSAADSRATRRDSTPRLPFSRP